MNSLILLVIVVVTLISVTFLLITLRLRYLDQDVNGVSVGIPGAARQKRREEALDINFPITIDAGGDTDDECEENEDETGA